MAENDQDIKHAKCRGGTRKKIQRDQLACVVFHERFPALRRRLPVSNYVLGYCGLRYLYAKFEQFSMIPWRTPHSRAKDLAKLGLVSFGACRCLAVPDIADQFRSLPLDCK